MSKDDTVSPMRAMRIPQSVASEIGTAILSGQISSGQVIGGEIEQSGKMGVSRNAYREAIRILVAKGLLESRPKTGTRVTPRGQWNVLDPEVLAWTFSSLPDERFVQDLFELRQAIEPVAAAIAAERRTSEHVASMEAALKKMRKFGLASVEGQTADREFHRALLDATGNAAFIALSSSIGAAVQWTTYFKQRAHESPRDPLPDHERLCAAVVAGDAASAREAMADLLRLALQDMKTI